MPVNESNYSTQGLPPRLWPPEPDWSYVIAGVVFAVAGTVGNVLVCLAVCLERRLQTVTNWFLVSLALADLLVSTVVMPFGAAAGFLGYWPLSPGWCIVYSTCDVLACSSSILHLCFISLGRYLGIRSPLRARHSTHRKRFVLLKVVLVWALAMLISSPLTVLGLLDTNNIMWNDQCVITHRTYMLFGSLAAFYLPMLIMVLTYALTVHLLRQKAARCYQAPTPALPLHPSASALPASRVSPSTNGQFRPILSSHLHRRSLRHQATQTPVSISREMRCLTLRAALRGWGQSTPGEGGTSTRVPPSEAGISYEGPSSSLHHAHHRLGNSVSVANEQKASKVLGVVFFTFVFCWAPFFILNVIVSFCGGPKATPVSDNLIALCLWLGYVSSTINPIIYTVFNRTFKRVFLSLLTCRCKPRGRPRSSRSVSVSDAFGLAIATLPAPLPTPPPLTIP